MDRMDGWRDRKDRRPVAADAVVRRSDGREIQVKLTDVSEEGCRIEAEEEFRIGEWIEIALPSAGQVRAQVRWSLGGSAGAKFETEPQA